MFARRIDGRIADSIGEKTAERTGNWIGGKIGEKIVKLIDGRTGVRIDRLTAVKIAGRMQGANFGASIEPIMWPVSMVGKGETTLVRPKWIVRIGRSEWNGHRGLIVRSVSKDLIARTDQIVWNDRSVRNVRIDLNGLTNRSGPAGTNTAGVWYWKMIGSRVS